MKNGFTLIELLAVIVLILVLTLITTISVSNILTSSKEKLNDSQKQIIEDATGMWIVDNLDKIPDNDSAYSCVYITFGELRDYGAIDDITLKNIEDDINNMIIRIDLTNDTKYSITVDAENTNNCNKVY